MARCGQRDGRSGVVRIAADGQQTLVAQTSAAAAPQAERSARSLILGGTLPNGIAFNRNGNILIGNFGTNEIHLDAQEAWLYGVERNARRISRQRVHADGSLSGREVFGPANLGGIPDGFAFDSVGNLGITQIMAERLIALTPEGDLLTPLDDGNPAAIAHFDRHFWAGTMTLEIMATCKGMLAPWMASLTFGGPDLKTVYLGSLMGHSLPCLRSPVAGLPMAHWGR